MCYSHIQNATLLYSLVGIRANILLSSKASAVWKMAKPSTDLSHFNINMYILHSKSQYVFSLPRKYIVHMLQKHYKKPESHRGVQALKRLTRRTLMRSENISDKNNMEP